jgi:hypothetical protein
MDSLPRLGEPMKVSGEAPLERRWRRLASGDGAEERRKRGGSLRAKPPGSSSPGPAMILLRPNAFRSVGDLPIGVHWFPGDVLPIELPCGERCVESA